MSWIDEEAEGELPRPARTAPAPPAEPGVASMHDVDRPARHGRVSRPKRRKPDPRRHYTAALRRVRPTASCVFHAASTSSPPAAVGTAVRTGTCEDSRELETRRTHR